MQLTHEKNLFINNIEILTKEYPVIKQITDNYLSDFINRYNNLHNKSK